MKTEQRQSLAYKNAAVKIGTTVCPFHSPFTQYNKMVTLKYQFSIEEKGHNRYLFYILISMTFTLKT
jgi:hypothetical protein